MRNRMLQYNIVIVMLCTTQAHTKLRITVYFIVWSAILQHCQQLIYRMADEMKRTWKEVVVA
jgi:hypothetical protein